MASGRHEKLEFLTVLADQGSFCYRCVEVIYASVLITSIDNDQYAVQ